MSLWWCSWKKLIFSKLKTQLSLYLCLTKFSIDSKICKERFIQLLTTTFFCRESRQYLTLTMNLMWRRRWFFFTITLTSFVLSLVYNFFSFCWANIFSNFSFIGPITLEKTTKQSFIQRFINFQKENREVWFWFKVVQRWRIRIRLGVIKVVLKKNLTFPIWRWRFYRLTSIWWRWFNKSCCRVFWRVKLQYSMRVIYTKKWNSSWNQKNNLICLIWYLVEWENPAVML